ncbi:MAG: (2Fe-2S)-binding protein [Rhodospirillaceae bacterium]
MVSLTVNGRTVSLEVGGDTPLLWVLRHHLHLRGTKFGCGVGACGACTVLVNGVALRACSVSAASVDGAEIQTIEGLAGGNDPVATRVMAAWTSEQVPQCGYCVPGMIVAAVALLRRTRQPADAEIDAAMTNLCRCGSYDRIRKAIRRAATAGAAP